MDLEKNDILKENSTVLDESFEPYFTDMYKAGEVKEQLEVGNEVKFDRVYCIASLSAQQNIPSGNNDIINFDTFDTSNSEMNTTNGRIIIPKDGIYGIMANNIFQANSTGARGVYILKNGVNILYDLRPALGASLGATPVIINMIANLKRGDYIQMSCFSNSGSPTFPSPGIENTSLRISQL